MTIRPSPALLGAIPFSTIRLFLHPTVLGYVEKNETKTLWAFPKYPISPMSLQYFFWPFLSLRCDVGSFYFFNFILKNLFLLHVKKILVLIFVEHGGFVDGQGLEGSQPVVLDSTNAKEAEAEAVQVQIQLSETCKFLYNWLSSNMQLMERFTPFLLGF